MNSLVDHTLFKGLPESQLQRILARSQYRDFDAGEILIELGTNNSTLYVLYEGEVNIILEDEGANLVLTIQPGTCIGDMSLILDRPTSAYAIAHKPSKVLLMPEDVFWNEFVNTKNGVKNLMRIMTERLKRNNQALIRQIKEQIHLQNLQKELIAAGKIQYSMVPDTALIRARFPQIDVHALLKQTAQVGGDFYDLLALDEDHIYFAIGDASGKGMTAALFMIRSLTALRMTVMNRPFEELLPSVNRILMQNNEESMFVSLFAGVLNVNTGKLRFVNAGHNPVMVALDKNPFEMLSMPRGSLLGVTTHHDFSMGEEQLQPGDILFMYTDGVTEAIRADNEVFEETRLLRALNQVEVSSMQQLVTSVDDSVTAFISGAPQYDDTTILALKYLGS